MPLIPGALYKFKCNDFWSEPTIIHKGVFVKENEYPQYNYKYIVFRLNRSTEISLMSKYVTHMIDTSPTLAKQVARGLCDRIPEDCAGIIERLLVGDKIVGKGPDRYEER
jgi:hypothetical protein